LAGAQPWAIDFYVVAILAVGEIEGNVGRDRVGRVDVFFGEGCVISHNSAVRCGVSPCKASQKVCQRLHPIHPQMP